MHLEGVDLFKFCSAEEIVRIARIAEPVSFDAGQSVYSLSDPASALYCVVQGEVKLEAPGGLERRVYSREAFGVFEILSGRLRQRSAVAMKDTLALAIEADDFFDLLSNNVEIVKALFREILDLRPERDPSVELKLA